MEPREDYESWVRALDAEKAAGDLTDAEYEAERMRYARIYGIERCPYCGAEPNIRCCEFGRDK